MRLVGDPRDGQPDLPVGDLIEWLRREEVLWELSMTS